MIKLMSLVFLTPGFVSERHELPLKPFHILHPPYQPRKRLSPSIAPVSFCESFGVGSTAQIKFHKAFKKYCYLAQNDIRRYFFFHEREKENKKDTRTLGGPAVGFPHWLDFKDVSLAWVLWFMVTWSDPQCPSFVPISYLVANLSNRVYYSGIGLVVAERKLGLFGFRASQIWCFVCVINIRGAGVLHYNVIVFSIFWIPYFLCDMIYCC